jgi:hypothetical protein
MCSSTGTSTQQIFFPTTLHRRVIWSSSFQLSTQRRLIHHLHLCLMTMHPALWEFTLSPCAQPQARQTQQISFLTALHRRIIWSSSQLSIRKRPSLRSSSVSDRNHTPLSGDLSQVCVQENVSRRCNHQQYRYMPMVLIGRLMMRPPMIHPPTNTLSVYLSYEFPFLTKKPCLLKNPWAKHLKGFILAFNSCQLLLPNGPLAPTYHKARYNPS